MGIYSLSARYLKGSTNPIPVLAEASSDLIGWANQKGLVGRLLREIIGPSFGPYAALPTIVDVANSPGAMQAIVASSSAMQVLSQSPVAMNAIGASSVARQEIWNNSGARNIVINSPMAIGKYIAGAAGLPPELYNDIYAITASGTAVSAIAGSDEAISASVTSRVAMTAVAESDIAMEAALNNETWRLGIANNTTAKDIVYSHLSVMRKSSRFNWVDGTVSVPESYMPYTIGGDRSVLDVLFWRISRRSYNGDINGTVTMTELATGRVLFSSSWSLPSGQSSTTVNVNRVAIGRVRINDSSSHWDFSRIIGYYHYSPKT